MNRRLMFGACFALAMGLAACSTGGGTVTSPNPLNPTPAGSGTIAPTTAPSGSATASPTPTATATSTSASNCAANDPTTPTAITTPLPPNGGTLTLPNFGDLSGTANAPAIASTDQMGQTVTIKISDANFDNVAYGTGTTSQTGTPVVFTSLDVSANVTFASATPTIPTTVTGSCEFNAPHTYSVGLYTFGSQTQLVTGLTPTGHTLTFTLNVPIQSFPASATGDVVITQN